jgi:hypothetical protein
MSFITQKRINSLTVQEKKVFGAITDKEGQTEHIILKRLRENGSNMSPQSLRGILGGLYSTGLIKAEPANASFSSATIYTAYRVRSEAELAAMHIKQRQKEQAEVGGGDMAKPKDKAEILQMPTKANDATETVLSAVSRVKDAATRLVDATNSVEEAMLAFMAEAENEKKRAIREVLEKMLGGINLKNFLSD